VIAMRRRVMASLALDLRDQFDAGGFTGRSRVWLDNGAIIDVERKARILLADLDRITQAGGRGWLTDREEQDDLLRLLALVRAPVRAYRRPGDAR
jgi:hypothetical protein